MGDSSLIVIHLRAKPHQKATLAKYGMLGTKIFDEFSQRRAKLFHADAYSTAAARAAYFGKDKVDDARYSEYSHTWGGLPVVAVAGDELQMPPVPAQVSLLAPIEGTSNEQKTGVKILNTFTHVYRLTTQMRFEDEVLKSILTKMREPGGCRLTAAEWKAMEETEVTDADSDKLAGTELYY